MVTVHSAMTPRGMSDLAGFAGPSVSAVTVVLSLSTTPIVPNSACRIVGYHRNNCLENATPSLASPLDRKLTRQQAIGLVFFCTLISAVAQIFFKLGAGALPEMGPMAIASNPLIALHNVPLLTGLGLYGVFMLLFVIA